MSEILSRPKPEPADIGSWLTSAVERLNTAGVPTARLDALVLLGDLLGLDRAWLLAHPEAPLTGSQVHVLNRKIDRRARHEPLAYIRQKVEFYGREFFVNKNVLVPRPESETMIELLAGLMPSFLNVPSRRHDVKTSLSNKNIQPRRAVSPHNTSDDSSNSVSDRLGVAIADVGTGSGALGITAALELARAGIKVDRLILTDIDPNCLAVAKRNSRTYKLRSQFHETNLLDQAGYFDIILANLPYVPDSHTINQAAMTEPKIAIFGGPDGLDPYRTLFAQLQAARRDWRPTYVLTESLPFQHAALADIAAAAGFNLFKTDDFIQAFTPA